MTQYVYKVAQEGEQYIVIRVPTRLVEKGETVYASKEEAERQAEVLGKA